MKMENEALNKLSEGLQSSMAGLYDAQFTELNRLVQDAYYAGVNDGKASAKAEIISLIKGD